MNSRAHRPLQLPPGRSYFGIASARAARLTVTGGDARERELRIAPWNGVLVVADPGRSSTLTGYEIEGNPLGALFIRD